MTLAVHDAIRQKSEQDVTNALTHLRRLLRIENQLRSPLLRLPTETILRVLSFVMDDWDSRFSYPWKSVYFTCHRIRKIMHGATELWWKADFRRARIAHITLMRSKGNPQVLTFDRLIMTDEQLAEAEKVLNHWRDEQVFGGSRLHTLEFLGSLSHFNCFSWILERPLPHVRRLKIHVTESNGDEDDDYGHFLQEQVELRLPIEMPLEVLDLRNVVLSWPSNHTYNRLRELHLDFRDCDPHVFPGIELFGILDASPQLERLSLLQLGRDIVVENSETLPPRPILRFPNLVSLALGQDPLFIKYVLEHMDLPAITSLDICTFIPPDMVQDIQNILFPDDRLPERLFPNPPSFSVKTFGMEGLGTSFQLEIGGITIRLDFPFEEGEHNRGAVMSCIPSLVPPSVVSLNLECTELNEGEWRDFFMSHPEVRSIECTEFCGSPVSRSLWDALLPSGEGIGIPCPSLESISITSYTKDVVFTPLSDCLRHRQAAGFKLKRLKMDDRHRLILNMDGFHKEFGPLAEVVEARKTSEHEQGVSIVSVRELGTD